MALAQLEVDAVEDEFAVIEQDQLAPARAPRSAARARCRCVPPAPVTSTRRPWISRAIASRSSAACGRSEQVLDRDRLDDCARGSARRLLELGQPRQPRQRDRRAPRRARAAAAPRRRPSPAVGMITSFCGRGRGRSRAATTPSANRSCRAPGRRRSAGRPATACRRACRPPGRPNSVAQGLADERVGAVLGADQQHRHAGAAAALQQVVEAAVLEQPVTEPRRRRAARSAAAN